MYYLDYWLFVANKPAMFTQVLDLFHYRRMVQIWQLVECQLIHAVTYHQTKKLLCFTVLLYQDNVSPETHKPCILWNN